MRPSTPAAAPPARKARHPRRAPALPAVALLVTLALALAAAAALAGEAAYVVDAGASTLRVRAWKDGVLSGMAHDHVVEARGVTGTVDVDPARPEGGRVALQVAAARLEVVDQGVSESDRRSIDESMKGSEVLDVAQHPTIAFRSTEVRRSARASTATAELDVTGDLTLHGVTKRITLPVTLRLDGERLVASGAIDLQQPDFGIEPYSAFLGAVKVRKDVRVEFEVTARRK